MNLKVICVEREDTIGELLRSEIIDKFVVDIGGSHIVSSRNTEILCKMLSYLGNRPLHRIELHGLGGEIL